MRPDDVHLNEMSLYPDDQSRDEWSAGDPALAAFVDDLRVIGSGPAPEPRPGLVAVMRQGPSVPTVSAPGRRKMLVKTVVGSLAAKLAFGVGAAAASVTAAGAAGVLPEPAQHAVASVVEATTPFALPDPSTVIDQVRPDISGSTTTTVAGGTVAGDTGGDDATGTRKANHGACVSAVAKSDTGSASHGKTVSSVARSDCGKTAASTSTTVVSSTTSTTLPGSTTTSTAVTTTTVADDAARSANSGRGNSSGNGNRGNGNSGNANSGNGGNSGRN